MKVLFHTRIHLWKAANSHSLFEKRKKKLHLIECFDFLNKVQGKYAYCLQWTPFYFSHFPTSYNIVIYHFLSENDEEVRMYEHICRLAVS